MLFEADETGVARRLRAHRVPDDQHARRRRQRRHGAGRRGSVGFTLPAAGKTGTTNDYDDAWFVGLHAAAGRRACGSGSISRRRSSPGGYAGDVAVPMWAQFMKAATARRQGDWFSRRRTSSRCRSAGCRASCPRRAAQRRGGRQRRRRDVAALDGLHRLLRARHGADRDLPAARRGSLLNRFAGLFGGTHEHARARRAPR